MAEVILTTVELAAFAQPLVDFLGDQDISARIRSDNAGGVDPALGFSNGTDILVDETDFERAKQLVEEWNSAEVEIPPQD